MKRVQNAVNEATYLPTEKGIELYTQPLCLKSSLTLYMKHLWLHFELCLSLLPSTWNINYAKLPFLFQVCWFENVMSHFALTRALRQHVTGYRGHWL